MFKKLISSILIAVMLLTIIPTFLLSANAEATGPSFIIKEISQEGNKVTVSVDLISGGFNAIDFQFNTSDGVTCDSINVISSIMSNSNTLYGKVSAISANIYSTPGSLITATFSVPIGSEYSISGSVLNCTITQTDYNGDLTNDTVNATVSGSVTGIGYIVPNFKIFKLSQEENIITVGFALVNGEFNTLDFQFITSDGVICDSINIIKDVKYSTNTENGKVSIISNEKYTTPGTFIKATFKVPNDRLYYISCISLNCTVAFKYNNGYIINKSITPCFNGKIENSSLNGTFDSLVWKLDYSGTLTISGNGKMSDYNINYRTTLAPWMNGITTINKVIIENGVTSIGAYAFANCTCLSSVVIPDSIKEVNESAFYNCSNLKEITVPRSAQINYKTFSDGAKLTLTSDNPSVVSVTSDGKITAVENGKATITATSSTGFYSTYVVNVATAKVNDVSIQDVTVKYKGTSALNPQISSNTGNYSITYETSNSNVATVNEDGNIITHGRGTAEITCIVTDGNGNSVKDKCTVTVNFSLGQWIIWILLLGFLWY